MLREVADSLAEDAGGWPHITNREKVLIERTAALVAILSSIERYIFRQRSLIDQQTSDLLPVLSQRYIAFSNTLRLNLLALGLKPGRPNEIPDLQNYLASKTPKAREEV